MFDDYSSNKQNQTREKRDALLFVKQKLDAAQWFVNAVKQRQETLLSTIKVIVDLQKDFFLTGDERNLKPMILKMTPNVRDMTFLPSPEPATANTCKQISAFIR